MSFLGDYLDTGSCVCIFVFFTSTSWQLYSAFCFVVHRWCRCRCCFDLHVWEIMSFFLEKRCFCIQHICDCAVYYVGQVYTRVTDEDIYKDGQFHASEKVVHIHR